MHLGHQEYNSGRLLAEAARDTGRADVPPPAHFSPDTPNTWRANRNEFFSAWIKHVYLTTPYRKPAGTPSAIHNECPVPPRRNNPGPEKPKAPFWGPFSSLSSFSSPSRNLEI